MWMTLNSQCLHVYWKWKGKNVQIRKTQTPHAAVQPSSTFFASLCYCVWCFPQTDWYPETNTVNGKRYQRHDWIVSRAVWRYAGLRLYMTSFMTIWKRVPSETLRLWMSCIATIATHVFSEKSSRCHWKLQQGFYENGKRHETAELFGSSPIIWVHFKFGVVFVRESVRKELSLKRSKFECNLGCLPFISIGEKKLYFITCKSNKYQQI